MSVKFTLISIVTSWLIVTVIVEANSYPPHLHPLSTYRKMSRIKNPELLQSSLEENIKKFEQEGLIKPAILFKLMLAESYQGSGNFIEAEKLFTLAYKDSKENLPNKKEKYYLIGITTQVTIFDPIDRLAFFYLTIGNVRQSEQLFLESRELREKFFASRSVHLIYPVVGLGSLHFRKGEYNKTYLYFSQANEMLARATTTGYDFDNLNRLFLNDLAEISMILQKNDEASRYINKLSFASSGRGKFNSKIAKNLETSRIFEIKARHALSEGDFDKTVDYLKKANHYYPKSISSSDVLFKLLKSDGLLNWYTGNFDQAKIIFQQLVNQYREHINQNFIYMSEYEKEQFYYTLKNDFNLFNAFVLDSESLQEELYNNILNTKALLLNTTNKLKNKIIASNDDTMIAKLKQWERLKSNLSTMYFQNNSSDQIDALKNAIAVIEKEINSFSGLFENQDNPPQWEMVMAALKEGEAAIEVVRVNTFNRMDSRMANVNNGLTDSTVYMILLLRPGFSQPEVFLLKNGNDLEGKFLSYYRNSILYSVADKITYQQFWLPIRDHIQGVEKLYFSADGVFNQINLNTLKNPENNKYLIDEIKLVNLTNTGDLLKKEVINQKKSAVLVGRPLFDFSGHTGSQKGTPLQIYGLRNLATRKLASFRDQKFMDLPGTEEEILQISSILEAQDFKVERYLGAEALEEKIKSVENPLILHIATHGFFLDYSSSTVSPMILSGIVLAGVVSNDVREYDDGILTAYEATNLNLDGTNVVVLSACQTGVGEVRNGEGVYGLQRAIIVAGARNLLMSLWKIDDEATVQLMVNFYRLRSGRSNQDAFREAQIELRDQYPDPFNWGAFIMIGN